MANINQASEAASEEGSSGLVARPPIHVPSFETLLPSRFDQIFLYEKSQEDNYDYRYRLTVVDRALSRFTGLVYATAVVIIPAGRESEYVFSSKRGLESVAESAQCARLVAVSLGRSHVFESEEMVQNELTFVVQVLSQQGKFLPPYHSKKVQNTTIPFMAFDGVGSRNALAEGDTDMSGRYLVEQVSAEGNLVRRLYFMDNPFVIQSEVILLEGSDNVVDKSQLAFEYHKHMAAGILTLSPVLEAEQSSLQGLVIGLGGAGLVNFLQEALPKVHLTVVELDSSVVTVAEKYFGFTQLGERTTVRIGDGLSVRSIEEADELADEGDKEDTISFPSECMAFIAMDVDSKDTSAGMSCPPVSFVEIPYLTQLKSVLRPDGVLAINVSARDPDMLQMTLEKAQSVFEVVYVSNDVNAEREDANVVLFCIPTMWTSPKSTLDLSDTVRKAFAPRFGKDKHSWEKTVAELDQCIVGFETFIGETKKKAQTKKKKSGGKKKGKRK